MVPELLHDGVVEVESFDPVKIKQVKHRTQGREQDAILNLNIVKWNVADS